MIDTAFYEKLILFFFASACNNSIVFVFVFLFVTRIPCITRYNDLFLIEQWGDSLSSIVLPIAEKKRAPPLASETST